MGRVDNLNPAGVRRLPILALSTIEVSVTNTQEVSSVISTVHVRSGRSCVACRLPLAMNLEVVGVHAHAGAPAHGERTELDAAGLDHVEAER